VIAALAAAGGVFYTGLSLDATQAQNDVAARSQVADRFTKAVDQLDGTGPEHLQARIGAIYALESLARDSPSDHPTVVEVLAAFIRSTASKPGRRSFGNFDPCPDIDTPADVQAALTVLGRRETSHDNSRGQIDLSYTCLRGVNLDDGRFAGANFRGVDLSHSTLVRTDLSGADLVQADLTATYLAETNLHKAMLINADLKDAYLLRTRLTHTTIMLVRHNDETLIVDVRVDAQTRGIWW